VSSTNTTNATAFAAVTAVVSDAVLESIMLWLQLATVVLVFVPCCAVTVIELHCCN
jgi:hypothetical protein